MAEQRRSCTGPGKVTMCMQNSKSMFDKQEVLTLEDPPINSRDKPIKLHMYIWSELASILEAFT